MTVTELLHQAQSLSREEKQELAQLILASLEDIEVSEGKTAAEILAILEQMPAIEFVNEDITDPVEWVKAQRQKEANRLNINWDEE